MESSIVELKGLKQALDGQLKSETSAKEASESQLDTLNVSFAGLQEMDRETTEKIGRLED